MDSIGSGLTCYVGISVDPFKEQITQHTTGIPPEVKLIFAAIIAIGVSVFYYQEIRKGLVILATYHSKWEAAQTARSNSEGQGKAISSVPAPGSKPRLKASSKPSSQEGFPMGPFHEKVKTVTIMFGTDTCLFDSLELQKGTAHKTCIEGLNIYLQNGTLHYHYKAPLWDFEIEDNEFSGGHQSWDSNSGATAFEVVNANQVPIFQLIRKSSTKIAVYGIFPTNSGRMFDTVSPEGVSHHPAFDIVRIDKSELKPIFRYPSWKYPGQYASDQH